MPSRLLSGGQSPALCKIVKRELLTLEEESCLVGNQVTGKILRRVHQAGNNRSPQIGTLKKVEEGRGSTELLFDLDCTLYHGQCLLSVSGLFITEALNGAKGLLLASATNKPPW